MMIAQVKDLLLAHEAYTYIRKLNLCLEYNDAYSNLNKSSLAQEASIFNEKVLSVLKCVDLLNKIIFLLNQVTLLSSLILYQGQDFPEAEKSKIFFSVTKLFQMNTPGT